MSHDPPFWRRWLPWIGVAAAALALRLPMVTLPGLGRDEAAYLYWSHFPEPGYAPLLQLLVALGRPLPLLAEARGPSVVAGVAVLVVFAAFLRARGADARTRWIAVGLVGLCPWQTYVGSILHPDDLQLLVTIGFALVVRTRPRLALLLAGIAPWTKPSGILVTLVASAWFLQRREARRELAVAWVLALVPMLALDPSLVRGLLTFARIDGDAGWFLRPLNLLVASVVLAGPALVVVFVRGLRGGIGNDPARWLGWAFVGAFGAAALVTGQVKGNWMLPAMLLLWPIGTSWAPLRSGAALISTAALSAIVVTGFVDVDATRALEQRWKGAPSYLGLAGTREAHVADATAWWHRLAEYRAMDDVCTATSALEDVDVLVSDDYGLAAQWAVRCPTRVPRLVLPLDPIFARDGQSAPRGALVLSVRASFDTLVPERTWEPAGSFRHPITGTPVRLARLTDDP